MPIDNHIFDCRSHFLSVSERKSRISSFSISSALILASCRTTIYRNSESLSVLGFSVRVTGRPFFRTGIPAAALLSFLYYLLKNSLTCSFVNPKCSAISRCVAPCAFSSFISLSYFLMCRYPLGIIKHLLWLLLYHRRCFFVTVRFYWFGSV